VQEAGELVAKYSLMPNQRTFGVLAMTCKRQDEAEQLLADMEVKKKSTTNKTKQNKTKNTKKHLYFRITPASMNALEQIQGCTDLQCQSAALWIL
jgi:hypothetical protein